MLPSPSTDPSTCLKHIGKYNYFVKNSSTKYFDDFSQVQSSIPNVTFMFHNGESQSSSIMHLLARLPCRVFILNIYEHIAIDYPKPS